MKRKPPVHKEPQAPRHFNKRIPIDLETVCLKALEKDPDRRYQSAAQMAEDLRLFLRRFTIHARRVGILRRGVKLIQRHRAAALATTGVVLVATLAGALVWKYWPDPPLSIASLRQITRDVGLTTHPALSADGKLMVFSSDRSGDGNLDIWLQQLEDHRLRGDARRLTSHPTDDLEPALSSDGSQVVFRSEREGGAIYVLPIALSIAKGAEKYLVPLGRRPRFSPDGRRVAYWTGHIGGAVSGALFVVPTEGGEPTPIVPQFVAARSCVWSPDGQSLLFLGRESGSTDVSANETDDW